MNTKTLKALTVAVSLLGGMGAASPAMAFSSTGVQSLGNGNNIDIWTFTCPAGFGARARVNDLQNPNPAGVAMQVALSHDGIPTLQVTDATDNGVPSAYTAVIPESGIYVMVFKKTGAAAEIYRGDVECRNANFALNNPVLTRRMNNLPL